MELSKSCLRPLLDSAIGGLNTLILLYYVTHVFTIFLPGFCIYAMDNFRFCATVPVK